VRRIEYLISQGADLSMKSEGKTITEITSKLAEMKVADPDHRKKLDAAIKSGQAIKAGTKKTTLAEEEAREKEERDAKEKMAKLVRLKSKREEEGKAALQKKQEALAKAESAMK